MRNRLMFKKMEKWCPEPSLCREEKRWCLEAGKWNGAIKSQDVRSSQRKESDGTTWTKGGQGIAEPQAACQQSERNPHRLGTFRRPHSRELW